MNETKIGGFVLLLAALTLLITIYLEYRIGWIGIQRSQDELFQFVYENWKGLQVIWGWQTLGHALFAISYLLLLKGSNGVASIAWSVLFLCGLLLVVSMGLTLGSYYPAMEVYQDHPAIFDSISGGIRILYRAGRIGSLFFLLVYFIEIFKPGGVLDKKLGLISFSIVAILIVLGLTTSLPLKVIGASWFFLPSILGYAYWKNADIKKNTLDN